MKRRHALALLCALALVGQTSYAKEEAKKAPETSSAPAVESTESSAPVDPTEALMRGLALTLPDVQKSVEAGTFKNLSPEAPKPVVVEVEPIPVPEPTPEPVAEPETPVEETPAPQPVKYTADQGQTANEITTDGAYDGGNYTSTKADENALRVSMAYITAKGDVVNKEGDSSNGDSSKLYGNNAAILVTHGGHGSFTDAKVTSKGIGATGAFAYSKGSYLNLTNSTVETTGDNAPLAVVAERATMKLANTTGTTKGNGSPALLVSAKDGIILAENSNFVTEGKDSHGIYSNGNVTVVGGSVNAKQTKAAVIKGNNTISLENATLEGNEMGAVPYNIVLFADDSAIGTMGSQQFSAEGSKLISHSGGMFLVTGTHSKITLVNTTIEQDPNLPVLTVKGNDGANGWGTPGVNGGHVQLLLDNQTLNGNIVVDTISDVNMSITKGSTWNGAIDIVPNAEGGTAYRTNADIFVSEGSVWNLTADSKVTSVTNLGTIHYNGHTITLADGTVMKE